MSRGRGRSLVFGGNLAARGGAEAVAVAFACVLRDLGFDSTLATIGDVDRAALEAHFGISLAGVRLVRLPDARTWWRRLPHELQEIGAELRWKRSIRESRPDVFVNCLHGCELPGLAPVSYYYTHFPHAMGWATRGPAHRAYSSLIRRLRRCLISRGRPFFDSYSRVLANSSFTAEHVLDRWGIRAEVLYPPVEGVSARTAYKEKLILSVGRFQARGDGIPHKRQDVLVSAFADSALAKQGWTLHLAGSVGSEQELLSLREMAHGAPVVFHPDADKNELHMLYARASVYWHAQGYGTSETDNPFAQEHFGISVVEAMSAGVIPVVYDAAGPREIVASVTGAGRWRTPGELTQLTVAVIADSAAAEQPRRAFVQRAMDFSAEAFRSCLLEMVDSDQS